jgi:formylglycine-generating enzyme required for sulfatase activity
MIFAVAFARAERRVALVIGNAGYASQPLRNPVHDAQDVAAALRRLGFQVTLTTDRNRSQMIQAIKSFGQAADHADVALFYFAGHGVQFQGRNFLLPVGQDFTNEKDIDSDAVNIDIVFTWLQDAAPKVSLLILDACRNNPLVTGSRSLSRGLARLEAPSGALVAFSAQPGAVAFDGEGRNGVYTSQLLKHIETPGLSAEQMFKRVRADVEQATRRQQSPREESSLTGEDFYFVAGSGGIHAGSPDIELQHWELIKNSRDAQDFRDFLQRYPQGRFAPMAQRQFRVLSAGNSVVAMPAPLVAPTPIAQEQSRDCAECPEWVVVPAGSFLMGSPETEPGRYDEESPRRKISLASFAIGKYEVTQAQWQALMGSNPSRYRKCGDNCPVDSVSWNDVQEFIRRLNARTGRRYRLPSEAQWEYAARAGTHSAYSWGEQIGRGMANCRNCGNRTDAQSTTPVGSFAANDFGLHDMNGNVWEWVEDCYDSHTYSARSANAGEAHVVAACPVRVLRGGSLSSPATNLRSAFRFGAAADQRGVDIGFRLVRALASEP